MSSAAQTITHSGATSLTISSSQAAAFVKIEGGASAYVDVESVRFTDNQIVAFFAALAASIFFFLVDKFLPFMPAGLTGFFEAVSHSNGAYTEMLVMGMITAAMTAIGR